MIRNHYIFLNLLDPDFDASSPTEVDDKSAPSPGPCPGSGDGIDTLKASNLEVGMLSTSSQSDDTPSESVLENATSKDVIVIDYDSDIENISEIVGFDEAIDIGNDLQPDPELLTVHLQDILREEMRMYADLYHLYDPKTKVDMYHLKRSEFDSLSLTPMCLNDPYLHTKIQSGRQHKLFYSLEWRFIRGECRMTEQDCIYNLIWYEPFAAFICMQGTRPRVFVCFSPLLSKDGEPTHLEFLYGMYTMCTNPIFVCFIRNSITNTIELWTENGKITDLSNFSF